MVNDDDLDLERDFQNSWVHVELQFAQWIIIHGRAELKPIYVTVLSVRGTRYDKKLRAGTSLDSLVVSRSKRHGLRPDQPRLGMHVAENNNIALGYFDGTSWEEIIVEAPKEVDLWYIDEARELIERLAQHPID